MPLKSMAVNRPEIKSEGALLIDANTGQLLYKKKESKTYDIGELTKLLSVYIIYDLIDQGTLSLDDSVTISDDVYALSQNYTIANVPLRQDKDYTVASLLKAVGTGQANSALMALIEHIDGDESLFVERMKKQLDEWQISDYEIYNATGMADEKRNKLSPIALALCAYHLLRIAPNFVKYTAKEVDLFDAGSSDEFEMLNPLIHTGDMIYEGIDGLMSGVDDDEVQVSVQTAKKDDLRLVSIVLNPVDIFSSHQDHKRLLTYGFSAFTLDKVLNKGQEVKNMANVVISNGKEEWATLEYGNDVLMVTPLVDTAPAFNYHFVPESQYFASDQLVAPLDKGVSIGQLQVHIEDGNEEYLPTIDPPSASIVLSKPIEKGNVFVRISRPITRTIDQWGTNIRKFFIRVLN